MISSWPEYGEDRSYKDEEEDMEIIMSVIRSIRNARAEMNVAPSRRAKVMMVAASQRVAELLEEMCIRDSG